MPSIEQNAPANALPDFRNLGVAVRIMLLGNAAGLAAALHGLESVPRRHLSVSERGRITPVPVTEVLYLRAVRTDLAAVAQSLERGAEATGVAC